MAIKIKDNSRRNIALLLCAIFVSFVCLSCILLHTETHHDCHGEECTVCKFVNECQIIIKDITKPVIFNFILSVLSYAFIQELYCDESYLYIFNLVLHKIRMNN